ncbi:N-acetylglucosamine-6-phosphate deacetylase [Pleurocapsales cyanobacterium LEGE 06147]|nr:N-acetylglucosamine-6-phosphate deacetylase [Pleurocapsales cyanobacterium LEGE 06147]
MISKRLITNARLRGYEELQQIEVDEQGKIEAIFPTIDDNIYSSAQQRQIIDVEGDWLSLGGVDLQINGGLGLAFSDLQAKDLPKLKEICAFLWQQGVDGFLPTIVTTAVEKIRRSLSVIAEFMTTQKDERQEAKILGVHLEGPFLNYEKRGAHPAEYLLPLNLDKVRQVLGDYSDIVKIITLAPELDETEEIIPYLRSRGIIVSLGHSLATAKQARQAFKLGASMVTHAFNAMPGLHHRQPGLLGEAIVNSHVTCGLIADGNHVGLTMMKILLSASNYDRGIFLVSDALAPIGLADGIYPWDKRNIEVKKGTARLADGTLAGTTLPLLVGVNNLVNWQICGREEAIAMATESPRKAIGIPSIGVGRSAQFLRWYWDEKKADLTWQRLDLFS